MWRASEIRKFAASPLGEPTMIDRAQSLPPGQRHLFVEATANGATQRLPAELDGSGTFAELWAFCALTARSWTANRHSKHDHPHATRASLLPSHSPFAALPDPLLSGTGGMQFVSRVGMVAVGVRSEVRCKRVAQVGLVLPAFSSPVIRSAHLQSAIDILGSMSDYGKRLSHCGEGYPGENQILHKRLMLPIFMTSW